MGEIMGFGRMVAALLVLTGWLAGGASAEEVKVGIGPDLPSVVIQTEAGPVTIQRDQDPEAVLEGEWALTSRECPPFCIQPMVPAEGVTPIGELELLEMLAGGEAVLIDSRTPDWFKGGTIPGAVNIPYTELADRLGDLGCEPDFDGWDCTQAKRVALFCNGLWCGQSPSAIRVMVGAGYPADRIFYYRGGMQVWRLLGLTVVTP